MYKSRIIWGQYATCHPELLNNGEKRVEKGHEVATIDMDVVLNGQEFRILRKGSFTDEKTKRDIEYMTLVIENEECEQQKVSVPQELRDDLERMQINKGEYLDLTVHVKAGSNYSSMKLVQVLRVYDRDGEVSY